MTLAYRVIVDAFLVGVQLVSLPVLVLFAVVTR